MSFKQSQSSWAALNPGCSETVSGESSSGVEMVKVTDAGFLMFVLYANMLELPVSAFRLIAWRLLWLFHVALGSRRQWKEEKNVRIWKKTKRNDPVFFFTLGKTFSSHQFHRLKINQRNLFFTCF